MAHIQQQDQCG